jgi:hypothetical protein
LAEADDDDEVEAGFGFVVVENTSPPSAPTYIAAIIVIAAVIPDPLFSSFPPSFHPSLDARLSPTFTPDSCFLIRAKSASGALCLRVGVSCSCCSCSSSVCSRSLGKNDDATGLGGAAANSAARGNDLRLPSPRVTHPV